MIGSGLRPIAAAAVLLLAAHAPPALAAHPPRSRTVAGATTPAPSSTPSPVATPGFEGRKVVAVDVVPPRGVDARELARFLEIRPGDPYSARKVRRTIEVLSRLGDFASIDVAALERADGLALTFRIRPIARIRHIYVNGVPKREQPIARNALGVQNGDSYPGDQDLPRMADDVQNAFTLEGWRDPKVEVKATTNESREVQLEVNIVSGPRLFIREIAFKGDFTGAFEEQELLAASGLKAGEPVRKAALIEAQRRLLALHRKLGYLEARIPEPLPSFDVEKPGWARVNVVVNSGEQISIEIHKGKIAWSDQRDDPFFWWSFRDSRLAGLIDLEGENQFSEGFGEEAADRIAEYYRRRGWYEAKVGSTLDVDPAKRKKTFRFDVDPGRRYRLASLEFKGTDESNAATSRKVLRDEFLSQSLAMRKGYYVEEDGEAAAYHLGNFLRSQGFADARVELRDPEKDHARHRLKILVVVDPGSRRRLESIAFEGNVEAPTTKLEEVVSADPVDLRVGQPLNVVYLDRADQAITDHYASIGFPWARVMHEAKQRSQRGEVDVRFTIEEGTQAFIGRVIVKGNRFTQREVIDRALPFRTGQMYTPQEMQAGQDALQKLGVFSQVNVIPFPEQDPERVLDILVGVSEANRILLEPSVGASTEEGPRIGLRAQHRNLFGSAKSLTLRAQANWLWAGLPNQPEDFSQPEHGFDVSKIEGRVLLTYTQPTTFAQPVTTSLTTSLFEKVQTRTWGYNGNRIIAAADRTLHLDRGGWGILRDANLTLQARYQIFLRDILYKGPLGVTEQDVALERQDVSFPSQRMYYWPLKWKVASGTLATVLDRRDDRFNPRDGYTANVIGELASAAFGSDVDFVKVTANLAWFRPLPSRFEVVLAARTGWARPLDGTAGLPIEQRFHLGGTGSVRGFREDSIGPRFSQAHRVSTGGDVMGLWNLELRHPMFSSVDWVLFDDAGWTDILRHSDPDTLLRQSPNFTNPGNLLRGELVHPATLSNGVGAGVRLRTPVGPVKFDLGIDSTKLSELNTLTGWQEDVIVHFTIGDF